MKKISLLMVLFLTACSSEAMKGYLTVKCVKEDKLRTIEDIHEEIYKEIKKHI